jgi:hypothetical protein
VEDAQLHAARFEATPIDPLPPSPELTGRRRRIPLFATVGLVALLIGFGVLAATFTKVLTGGNVAAVAPADTSNAVTLAPAPAEPEDTAGPGVRMIAPDGSVAAQAPAATTDAPAAVEGVQGATATQTAALPPASSAPVDSPLPRLRPSMTATSGAPAQLPVPAAGSALPSPVANLPPPAAGAPAQQGDDVNALMSDVDRILQQHRTTAPAAPLASGTAAPMDSTGAPMPVTGAAPLATADAGMPAMTSPAPLDIVAPPPPQPRRWSWFLFPNRSAATGLPVPPADIPDAEGAPGQ